MKPNSGVGSYFLEWVHRLKLENLMISDLRLMVCIKRVASIDMTDIAARVR